MAVDTDARILYILCIPKSFDSIFNLPIGVVATNLRPFTDTSISSAFTSASSAMP